ncbi:MAG: hypothetical protein IKV40_01600 [Clostridia bacterium]|nr:hypothetical protein [Clostridia bacterium]
MKKIIAILLLCMMILPTAVSCGKDSGKEALTTDTETASGTAVAPEEIDPLVDDIEEHVEILAEENNFKGKSFTWIGGGYQAPEKEEEIGDVQSDALYFRQRDIEELFEIDWSNYIPEALEDKGSDPITEAVKQDVLAGSGAYDAGYGMSFTCTALIASNSLLDMSEFETMDLDMPWWTQSLRDTYSMAGALYLVNGPILTCHYQDAASVVYNKVVAEDYGIDGLYDIVRSGEWTFDKMFEIASVIPENQSGAGAYRYGDPDAVSMLIAQGVTITKFDEEGKPYLEDNIDKTIVDIADEYCRIFGDDTQTVNTKGSYSGSDYENFEEKYGYESYEEMFADDKILFLFIPTDEAAWLRIHEVQFGILPMPKASVSQEDYISYATPVSAFDVFTPKSTKDAEVTDVILEAMAALGYKYFKPVFYDTMLKSRMVYDYESKDMIDIIFNTKRHDMINMFDEGTSINGPGSVVRLLNGAVTENSQGLTSRFFIQSKVVNGNIREILANLEADRNR